jgi:hypothetical protein
MGKSRKEQIFVFIFQALELIMSKLTISENVKTACYGTKTLGTLAMIMFTLGHKTLKF